MDQQQPPPQQEKPEGASAENASFTLNSKIDVQALPIRAYLDQTVVPLLLQALSALVRERPADPVEYVAAYLLRHNPMKANPSNPSNPQSSSI
ncbi:putative protein dpy-30 [Paratrimastix pyriformis]|uniref:Protein dpy-30 homolog n=1 Tax=Paratrimastix pyriformis TaxID=342808 RepID=A0ABQ8ULS9_9EUKA|nr:putative protein dpy-30 [Paratrimastix pyriformis]